MLKIIYFLLFILHNIAIFKYLASINNNKINNYKIYYVSQALNIILIYIFWYFDVNIHESLFMIIYFLALTIEFKLVFNTNWLKNLFNASCFSVVLFSVKLILISLYSIFTKIPLYILIKTPEIDLAIISITLFLADIYLILSLILYPFKYMNMMTTSKENLKLSVSILISLFLFLIANTYLLYIENSFSCIPFLTLKIGICCIILFLATLQYYYLFSKLQLYVIKAKNIEKELKEEELLLDKLKNEALYDDLTSCLKRDYIFEKIDELLLNTPFFCIAFVDIDGLKITNDVYGHDEGDFYIKTVSDILVKEFVGKIVARIGGDEFLVLLNFTDAYATNKCLARCYENVANISKEFNKPYQTSISYGIIQVTPENTLSREELIKIADEQMYKFKKVRKKNRK